jgi:hypothetical protein
MTGSIIDPTDDMAKEVFASDSSLEEFSVPEKSQSTWQMLLQYKTAVLCSTFIGLGAFNWEMDVLVSTNIPVKIPD